jgi:hypothetical protein
MSFDTLRVKMTIAPQRVPTKAEQKKRLLKAKIVVALRDELGRVPKSEEIEQVFLLTRVMYKAVLGLHFKRREQKESGQLPIF